MGKFLALVMAFLVGGCTVFAVTSAPETSTVGSTTSTTTTTTTMPTTTTVYRTTTTIGDELLTELAFDAAWGDMSYTDRSNICSGVELFGMDGAIDMIQDGAGDTQLDRAALARKLEEVC